MSETACYLDHNVKYEYKLMTEEHITHQTGVKN